MKRFAVIIILLFTVINIYAQDYKVTESELVTSFPVGDSEGALGYRIPSSDSNGPTTVFFDSVGNLYVNDYINKRICIFDKNWEPLKVINLNGYCAARRMEIDFEGNFIGYYGSTGIQKIDKEGNIIFFLDVTGEDIYGDIRNDGLYNIDDMVVAFNKKNGELIGFTNLTPDYRANNKNPLLDTQQVIRALEQSSNTVQIEKKALTIPMQRSAASDGPPTRNTATTDEYVIFKDGELLNRDFDTLQQSKPAQSRMLSTTSESDGLYGLYSRYKVIDDKYFYGTDNDGNEYWHMRAYMFVINSNGVPIKAIKLEIYQRSSGLALSEDGEIYYLYSTKNGHSLYKYKRVW